MNKRRRTSLNKVLDELERLKDPIDKATALQIIQQASTDVRSIADDEEESLDNRPEGLRWSTVNDDMTENVSDLNDAADDMEILAENCQDMEVFKYEPIKSDVVKIVTAIKQTINR
ncbi:MAG: hypothetical protein NC453_16670 [Muribaculum sp.]|nr:hypothetical protein [Muribaculum sp.]